jgi:hypothetical protein
LSIQENGAVTKADPTGAWTILNHRCRSCGGRVLKSADRAHVRCADCGSSADGYHSTICWCGALPAGSRAALRRVLKDQPTPEFPSEVLAVEATTPCKVPSQT